MALAEALVAEIGKESEAEGVREASFLAALAKLLAERFPSNGLCAVEVGQSFSVSVYTSKMSASTI